MIYGYCRVSTQKQSIERQERNILHDYPDAVIVKDIYTGSTMDRPHWTALLAKLKSGDTVVFDAVSRMSRTEDEGYAIYERLFQAGVELVFIKEPYISTVVYRNALQTSIPMTGTAVDEILAGVNRYLMTVARDQIRLAFAMAAKELSAIHQRTSEGIATARIHGKQIGRVSGTVVETRKSKQCKEIILKRSSAFNGNLSDAETMLLCGCSRNSYYKYKRELADACNK